MLARAGNGVLKKSFWSATERRKSEQRSLPAAGGPGSARDEHRIGAAWRDLEAGGNTTV